MISNVPPSERILSAGPGSASHSLVPMMHGVPVEEGKCALASGTLGQGRVSFFGDVNAEEWTLDVVSGMAKVSCETPGRVVVD